MRQAPNTDYLLCHKLCCWEAGGGKLCYTLTTASTICCWHYLINDFYMCNVSQIRDHLQFSLTSWSGYTCSLERGPCGKVPSSSSQSKTPHDSNSGLLSQVGRQVKVPQQYLLDNALAGLICKVEGKWYGNLGPKAYPVSRFLGFGKASGFVVLEHGFSCWRCRLALEFPKVCHLQDPSPQQVSFQGFSLAKSP